MFIYFYSCISIWYVGCLSVVFFNVSVYGGFVFVDICYIKKKLFFIYNIIKSYCYFYSVIYYI